MNLPLGIMLRFLVYTSGGEMVPNVIECESLLGVYDLNAGRGVYRLFEMKGRNWCRDTSVPGRCRLHEYNRMVPSLGANMHSRSYELHCTDMIVIHPTQVPDAKVVDMVQRQLAMVVH
jgi:hypothetical protein